MGEFILFAALLISVAIVAINLAMRCAKRRSLVVPAWCSAQAIGFFLGTGVAYSAFDLWSVYTPPLSLLEGPGLSVGERPLALKAGGWLNGTPLSWDKLEGRVVVVDVSVDWCPYCHYMAWDLVRIRQCFADDQVAFISLTPDDETTATKFAQQHHINWPVGWGADNLIQRYFVDAKYPAVILVGRDGRVVWNDGAARHQHRSEEGSRELFEQIKNAL